MISKFATCAEIVHPWTSSCTFVSLELFYNVFRRSFRIYGTLFLIAAIIRRKKLKYFKKRLLAETLRSTSFLTLNGTLFVVGICRLRHFLGQFTVFTSSFLPGLISGLSILVERPNRRGLLALYMFNNALEAVFNMLVNRNIISSISYGEVYMFCGATATLMYLYRKKKLTNAYMDKVLRFTLGEQNSPKEESRMSNFQDMDTSSKTILKRIIPTAQAFSIGYLVHAIPGIIGSIFQPRKILRVLVQKNNFKLALFFSSFVGIFQTAEFLLNLIRKEQDSLNSLIAGAVSGASLLFYRSSTISLYLFTKVTEILFKNAQSEGILPFIPHADIIIYIISTAITFHACLFEWKSVRPSYWKFLSHITSNMTLPASKNFPLMVFGR